MVGTKTTAKKPHQVPLHMLGLHPLPQVVDGVQSLVLDQDQLRHHRLKLWLPIKLHLEVSTN